MYLQDIKSPRGSRKRRKIVGRGPGSGHGKTSCRGHGGQNSRSGRGIIKSLGDGGTPLIRRLPKVGFNSKRPIFNQIVNVGELNKFEKGTTVTAHLLKAKGLIKSLYRPFKILGEGEIKKALTIHTESISKSAQEKIEKAGGKVEIVEKKIVEEKDLPKN